MNTHIAIPNATFDRIIAALEDADTKITRLLLTEVSQIVRPVSLNQPTNVKSIEDASNCGE